MFILLSSLAVITPPCSCYYGTPLERNQWRLIGQGMGIHWPELDEDLSVEGLLLGKKSTESQSSLARWLEKHRVLQPIST